MGYPVTLGPEEKLHVLLPSQYLDIYQRTARLNPDKELMLAVLQDAVDCFQKNLRAQDSKGKARFGEVEEWIMAGEREELFFFERFAKFWTSIPVICAAACFNGKKECLASGKK